MVSFDAEQYKVTTCLQWQSAAEAWRQWRALLDDWLGAATECMLDMAQIAPADYVLDVAAGAGSQTLQAARRLGEAGSIIATDIAPNILAHIHEDALAEGLTNVRIQPMDGEDLRFDEGIFDVVLSRLGLMYFPHQHQALVGMRRVLKVGGRVAVIVYSTAENNPFFALPLAIIRRHAQLPPPAPGQPGPFSLGAPGVLVRVLHDAGFREVEVRQETAPLRFPSAAECVRFERESFGALHQMLIGIDADEQVEVWNDITQALQAYEDPHAFIGPCELLVAIGVK